MQVIRAANCDCNAKMNQVLERDQGTELPIKTYGNMTSDILVARLAIIVQMPSGYPSRSYTCTVDFCPWCGTKYKTQEEIDAQRAQIEEQNKQEKVDTTAFRPLWSEGAPDAKESPG
jgi:hypothetical protein